MYCFWWDGYFYNLILLIHEHGKPFHLKTVIIELLHLFVKTIPRYFQGYYESYFPNNSLRISAICIEKATYMNSEIVIAFIGPDKFKSENSEHQEVGRGTKCYL